MSLLIIGGTGTLGRQIVRRALNEGFSVKCLVRNFRKSAFLKEWGAELMYGDLALPETIPVILYGITAIIDASTVRVNDLYSLEQIDLKAKYILIEAAKKAKIKHYISFSILNASYYADIPLVKLKLLVEKRLTQSKICYTIFNLSGFFQGLIQQYAIPILDQKSIWVTKESSSISYINTEDIAKIVIKSLSVNQSKNQSFSLTGNHAWTSMQIIDLCEKISGKRAKIAIVPISLIKILQNLTKLFQWTWNISDKLAFISVVSKKHEYNSSTKDIKNMFQGNLSEIEPLELYLEEYFQKIMKKVKELNYQLIEINNTQESNDF
uniref:NmrA-like domain-containing protein n=1 Tax=Nitophyllum punctatum TaxID=158729 RepID=A0A4D6WUT8_9FLOR|nr:hypothetical protein [Nitophyllum punctatum]